MKNNFISRILGIYLCINNLLFISKNIKESVPDDFAIYSCLNREHKN